MNYVEPKIYTEGKILESNIATLMMLEQRTKKESPETDVSEFTAIRISWEKELEHKIKELEHKINHEEYMEAVKEVELNTNKEIRCVIELISGIILFLGPLGGFAFGVGEPKPKKPHILVVDDEPNICQILQDRLEMNEYKVTTTPSLKGARAKIGKHHFDLIVLDQIILTGSKDVTLQKFIRELREDNDIRIASIPIIMMLVSLTATFELSSLVRGDDHIIKPFDLSEMLEKIEQSIDCSQSNI